MDFDEYDYLEKAVEKLEPQKSKEVVNGGEGTVKSEERDRNRSSKHRSDRNDDDSDRRSKRTKSDGESRSLDKDRSSSRHLSSLKDREKSERYRHRSNREHNRDKERDREERNGKERSGGRDRDRDRERDHDKEKREGGHEHDRERDRDKNIELSRRSRSHSERRRDERDREKSQEREKSQDKEYKNRERATELTERDRGSRRYKEKKEDKVEPEADPERDQRTVFAYQISLKADEKDVYEFFSRAGKVRDVRLIMDRNSRRSKGVGYIEFYDSMAVPMAIALSGQPLLGQPVMVKPSEAEKNLVQSTASALGGGGHAGPYSGGGRRLYVGNLHLNITEDQLRQVFEAFGAVELVQLPIDLMTGFSKGFGFVQFARLEDAVAAQSLNGQLDIAGRTIKVSAITDQAAMLDAGVNTADFDDDESGGLSLNAQSRALLMQKLDRSGTTPSVAGSLATTMVNSPGLPQPGSALPGLATLAGGGLPMPALTVPSVDTVGVPSECFLLKNMFDPSLETEPDFDLDIKEDVEAECSKFGALKHIYVDKNSAGFVYLRFEDTQAAVGAQRALHGRWFAGKMITATFMVPQTYEAKFPDSR